MLLPYSRVSWKTPDIRIDGGNLGLDFGDDDKCEEGIETWASMWAHRFISIVVVYIPNKTKFSHSYSSSDLDEELFLSIEFPLDWIGTRRPLMRVPTPQVASTMNPSDEAVLCASIDNE